MNHKMLKIMQATGMLGGKWPTVLLPQNLLSGTVTLIEDFETGFAKISGDTVADDVTNVKTGSKSLQITSTTAVTKAEKTTNVDISSSMGGFRVWIYKYTGDGEVSLFLSANTGITKYYQFNINSSSFHHDGWNLIEIQAVSGLGGMTINDPIIKIRAQVNSVPMDYSFDSLYTVPRQSAAIMLRFDDAYDSVFTLGRPIFKAHHVRPTIFMCSNSIGAAGYLSGAQLLALQDDGITIGNHTADHPNLTELTEAQQEAQISECALDLAAIGITTGSKYFASPLGSYNADTLTALSAQGMLLAQGVSTYQQFISPADPLELRGIISLASTVSLASAKGSVDTAILNKRVLTFLCHKLTVGAPPADGISWSASDYEALIAYIASKNIPIITIDDFYKLQLGSVAIPKAV